MRSSFGDIDICTLLVALDRDLIQHDIVVNFIQYKLDDEWDNVELLHQQGSYQAIQLNELGAE